SGAPEYAHVASFEPDFFVELAEHGLLGGFAVLDPALRKLPRVLIDPFAPEHLVALFEDDDSHVGTLTILVDHFCTRNMPSRNDSSTIPATAKGAPERACAALSSRSRHSAQAQPRCVELVHLPQARDEAGKLEAEALLQRARVAVQFRPAQAL